MDKIIFLDIDGVLNSDMWLRSLTPENWPASHIDPEAVAVLNQIICRTEAKCVISSAWRKQYSLDYIKKALSDAGFTGEIVGQTPDFFALRHQRTSKAYTRGDEIQAWIDQQDNKPEAFLILDDCEDMAHLTGHLIKTDGVFGLLPEHVKDAVIMLGCEFFVGGY